MEAFQSWFLTLSGEPSATTGVLFAEDSFKQKIQSMFRGRNRYAWHCVQDDGV